MTDPRLAELSNFIRTTATDEEAFAAGIAERVKAGVDLNAPHEGRSSLLTLLVSEPRASRALKVLLAHGARADVAGPDGRTGLHLVAATGSGRLALKLLLDAGAAPDARDDQGRTALHLAAKADGHSVTDLLELLVERGASLDVADAKGKKAVDLARGEAKAWLAKRSGPKISEQEQQLFQAISDGKVDTVRALISAGVNPCRVDTSGGAHGYYQLEGVAPIHVAMSKHVPVEVGLAVLAAPKLDVHVKDEEKNTPLHHAVNHNEGPARRALVERLLALGADPSKRNDSGDVPAASLTLFRELTDQIELLQLFESKGLKLSKARTDETLVETMYSRIERLSDVNDKPGFTRMLRFLVDRGVKAKSPAIHQSIVKWLGELEAKYVSKTRAAATRPQIEVDLSGLGELFGEKTSVKIKTKSQPVAFFDFLGLEVEHENDESEHADVIWQYHVPSKLQPTVKKHHLVPIGVVGMTGSFDSFAEEGVDGTLFVDLRKAKGSDAPVMFCEKDGTTLEPVSPSFKKLLRSVAK